ncbi:MAG: hypothetical protein J6P95_00575 [Paludibacteraceae bacterium]|nr:hypothetical protein [Paludibacteraceae bacterium]
MAKEKDLIEFDDQDAIDFILNYLSSTDFSASEEEIQYVLDLIYEYYEQNDLMEDEVSADNAMVDEDEMLNFVFKLMNKEKVFSLEKDVLQVILDGEYEYGKSIGIYTEG